MIDEIARGDVGIKGFGVLSFPHPRVLDRLENEAGRLSAGRLKRIAIETLRPPSGFAFRTNDWLCVVGEGVIVGADALWRAECLAVFGGVFYIAEDDTDEVILSLRLVVGDLEEDRREHLADERDVDVRRLALDWLEEVGRLDEFRHDLLGRHRGRGSY